MKLKTCKQWPRASRAASPLSLALVLLPASCAVSYIFYRPKSPCSCEPTNKRRIEPLVGVLAPKCGGAVLDKDQKFLGRVEAWKDVTWKDPTGGRIQKEYIQLSFHSKHHAKDAHWIQFIRRQKWDRKGNPVDNSQNIPVDYSLWHRRGQWFLDAPRSANSPFYEEWGLHHRTNTELSILDQPLGSLNRHLHSKLVIELDSYLIVQGMVVWRIQWQVVETPDNPRQVVFLSGGQAQALPYRSPWKIGYSHRYKTDKAQTVYLKNSGFLVE